MLLYILKTNTNLNNIFIIAISFADFLYFYKIKKQYVLSFFTRFICD